MPAPSGFVIMCSRGGRNSGGPCVGCKRTAGAYLLCDFPVLRDGRETTCDRRICRSCALSIGPDRDLCPSHAPYWDAAGRRFTIGPQAAPPLRPFVEPDVAKHSVSLTKSADRPPDEKAEANRTGGGFAEPVHVPQDEFRPVLDDDDTVERLQQLELPDEP